MRTWAALIFILFFSSFAHAETNPKAALAQSTAAQPAHKAQTLKEKLKTLTAKSTHVQSDNLIFDLPVTYNKKVSKWVSYFQNSKWFSKWLQRSYMYMPFIQIELKRAGLPQDLAYMVMIESGFAPNAISTADAVGPWQFIEATGSRYGLNKTWWLDERRDLKKSTLAAIRYIQDLYGEFGSWYLVAASYNMGENGLRRQIKKYGTKDYWTLIKLNALPQETQDYVPKILAAMLIAKAPNLYGFRDLEKMDPLEYEVVLVPGGVELNSLADHLGVTRKSLKDLNAELYLGYIPRQVEKHFIRVPKGASRIVSSYVHQINRKVALE
ncbi:lytic transglycosylase domain-containing protein [Bdellovibrio reynosensis]|uniref:Lytic transglycosylase domain-containing protein n=1 Tax=Bdellovibrio reynosensis TaxID=2835041 RepID=A0ABY4C8B9_9BACT|nr:lytic transglycosylase domain-containing protein [Bdellovibrio reynosensis]UOE99925.1 lytic transglycosylase domain-containing protein [Bdellovibrio reynosensis]